MTKKKTTGNNNLVEHLLFVDIDGVLTSEENGNAMNCMYPENYDLDKKCLKNLLALKINIPDLKVVVHSSWVLEKYSTNKILWEGRIYNSLLPKLDKFLQDNHMFLGHADSNAARFNRIMNWLHKNINVNISKDARIVILDDSNWSDLERFNGFGNCKFILTDRMVGFSNQNAKDAIDHLKAK